MSRLVSRILLSMFMFPVAVLLYALVMGVGEALAMSGRRYTGYRTEQQFIFLVADAVTWAGVATYWCLLWRSGVRWTAGRVGGTVGAAVAAAVVGGLAALALIAGLSATGSGGGVDLAPILFLGGVLAILLWVFATVFIWRETAAERAARVGAAGGSVVTCPTCGYNLTGLHDTRCPECGSRFTLNELLAAQPARATAGDLD